MKIIVTRKGDGMYNACLESDPKVWGRGKTENEAIGDLIKSHPDDFKVSVECR